VCGWIIGGWIIGGWIIGGLIIGGCLLNNIHIRLLNYILKMEIFVIVFF